MYIGFQRFQLCHYEVKQKEHQCTLVNMNVSILFFSMNTRTLFTEINSKTEKDVIKQCNSYKYHLPIRQESKLIDVL